MTPGSRLRQIGWAIVLGACLAIFAALTFRVNAVKSEVALAERQIIALEREKLLLETEFQARTSQQQLADWNRIEYGYAAPRADQYLDNERQLAALGMARADGAPDPIRVAQARSEAEDGLLAMVSPLTGEPVGEGEIDAAEERPADNEMSASRSLADRLTRRTPLSGPSARSAE